MPTFRYKALGQSGALDQGVVTAKDMAGAQRQLRAQKLTPIYVSVASDLTPNARAGSERDLHYLTPKRQRSCLERSHAGRKSKKVKRFDRDDVLRFTAEMSVLLRAGCLWIAR